MLPLSTAAAAPLTLITHCGQTLANGSYLLATDLTCSTGFVVKASEEPDTVISVSVNLGGHRLRGTGVGTAFLVTGYPFNASLTVANGRVDHWVNGVGAGTGRLIVDNVQINDNTVGSFCEAATCTINDSVISNNTTAMSTYESGEVTLADSMVSNNREASHLLRFSKGTYLRNVFYNNTIGVNITEYATVALTENVFLDNSSALQAVVPEEVGYDITMTKNLFTNNRDGVRLDVTRDQGRVSLKGNTAVRNSRYGIYAPGATDLGGNLAGSNGARPQCVGLTCGAPSSNSSKPWLTAAQIRVLSSRSRRSHAPAGSTPAAPDPQRVAADPPQS